MLLLEGWVAPPAQRIFGISLLMAASEHQVGFRADGASIAFRALLPTRASTADVLAGKLLIRCTGGAVFEINNLGAPIGTDDGHALMERFRALLAARPAGTLLEIGSRNLSGITRRDLTPPGWSYCGMDVRSGPNVDVVGDAHELATWFGARRFQAAMALSVLEHLLMPWKFALELNRVLEAGGVAFFITHQSWPVHEAPWDYWRLSDKAWHSLFNPATGFEIVEAQMGELAHIVPNKLHRQTAFADVPSYLMSAAIVRKTADTQLQWPVALTSIVQDNYPR